MNDLTPDTIAQVTALALERTAFMMADPVPVEASTLAAADRLATIRYSGPSAGVVTLRTNNDFLRGLAANLLGVEPDTIDLASCGDDAIKELTNIVGGSVILQLGGRDCTYSLGLPQLAQPTKASPTLSRTCALDCEGHPLFITWDPEAKAA